VITVDIRCDLNDEDETGLPFAFVDEAADPSLIFPGAIVVAGDEEDPAVAEVVDVVDKPSGTVAHLNLLPGTVADYQRLVQRAVTPA
jgi:hypothetical protein